MMTTETLEVALFPIPNMVTFPGAEVPLHIFEPRYRTMVEECVENTRMVAVCHTKKQISAAKADQSITDVLSNNQATYSPKEVFCAGYCNVSDRTADGRIYLTIKMLHRVKLAQEIQTLPYRIAKCSIMKDEITDSKLLGEYQAKIVSSIFQLIRERAPTEVAKFDNDKWLSLDPSDFAFNVFQVLRFEPELMQTMLEMTDPEARLKLISDTLSV